MVDIRLSTVGIVAKSSSDNKFSGTGFFIEGGFILTCAHVVNTAQVIGDKVQFLIEGQQQFYDAEIVLNDNAKDLDICILRPLAFTGESLALRIVASHECGGKYFRTFGYPLKGTRSGLYGDGYVHGRTRDALGRDVLQCTSKEITYGYSGCPVWVDDENGVVGMVSAGFDLGLEKKLGETVYAIPSEVIKSVTPNINLVDPGFSEPRIEMLIKRRNFKKALEECEKGLENDPNAPLVHLLIAISILEMKGANKFGTSTVRRVESHLKESMNIPKFRFVSLIILGLIKYDHYEINGRYQDFPSVREIKGEIKGVSLSESELNLVNMINASPEAFEYFGILNLWRNNHE